MELGKLGVLGLLDTLTSAETGQLAQKIERLGYSALWFPEQLGREVFSFASYLLSQTERLICGERPCQSASGPANVFGD